MTNHSSAQSITASCSCGKCQLRLDAMPTQRFLCHCTICQGVYQSDFADATITLARHVEVLTPGAIRYIRHKAPPVLDRGTCTQCGDPVLGTLKMPALPLLAFVPTAVLPPDADQPKPARHIHYGTRVREIDDDLPKTKGELISFLALTPAILKVVAKG